MNTISAFTFTKERLMREDQSIYIGEGNGAINPDVLHPADFQHRYMPSVATRPMHCDRRPSSRPLHPNLPLPSKFDPLPLAYLSLLELVNRDHGGLRHGCVLG